MKKRRGTNMPADNPEVTKAVAALLDRNLGTPMQCEPFNRMVGDFDCAESYMEATAFDALNHPCCGCEYGRQRRRRLAE